MAKAKIDQLEVGKLYRFSRSEGADNLRYFGVFEAIVTKEHPGDWKAKPRAERQARFRLVGEIIGGVAKEGIVHGYDEEQDEMVEMPLGLSSMKTIHVRGHRDFDTEVFNIEAHNVRKAEAAATMQRQREAAEAEARTRLIPALDHLVALVGDEPLPWRVARILIGDGYSRCKSEDEQIGEILRGSEGREYLRLVAAIFEAQAIEGPDGQPLIAPKPEEDPS